MPRKVIIDGQEAMVPDDATDEEINSLFPAKTQQFKPTVSIGAALSGENPVTQFFQQSGQDLTQGGNRTAIGRILGMMQGRGDKGYTGLNAGVSEGTANFMGSPELGVNKTLEGLASIPQHPIAGPMKALSGVLQAATIPSLVVGSPGAQATFNAIPSAANAGRVLDDIAQAAGKVEVPLKNSQDALQRLAELSERGGAGNVPAGVTQLINRSQGIAPMIYPEARDFASNISRLSANDRGNLIPTVERELGNLRSSLSQDIANSVQPQGLDQAYLDAIREYAKAQKLKGAAKTAVKIGVPAAIGAGVVGKVTREMMK